MPEETPEMAILTRCMARSTPNNISIHINSSLLFLVKKTISINSLRCWADICIFYANMYKQYNLVCYLFL